MEPKQDKKVSVETITITPNYEHEAAWFAHMLSEHGFNKFALEPVISLIEMTVYLTKHSPEAIERVLDDLRGKAGLRTKKK